MESLNKNYIKSVLGRLSGLDLLSGSVSECMCKLYDIDTLLPDCEVELPGCHGLHRKHGLYLQCCDELYEGDLCKKCTTKASNSSYGKPPHGLIEERRGKGPSYIAPDGGKAVSFANVVEELGINLEDAKYYAESLSWVIPESELIYKEKKRGRPKKEKQENNEPAKKRGRPKKEEIIQSQDDMIAELASQLELQYEATDGKSNSDRWEEEKVEKKRIKEEKEAEKEKKKLEKKRIKKEKEVERANKKAEKERLKVEKELERANKKAEKERLKAGKKVDSIKEKKNIENDPKNNEDEIKVIQPYNKNESEMGETLLVDGAVMGLDEDFSGVVTRIGGVQYIITDGFPGDNKEDKEKIVWLVSSLGEVENIGIYDGENIILD
jgi:hypothetical protein